MTPKQLRFVDEYLKDLNATQAAIRSGYSERTAEKIGWENLQKPEIRTAVAAAQAKRAARVQMEADDVLRDLIQIHDADPRELVEYRRDCCRYCWGKGFRYQRTPGEMERDREAFEAKKEKAKAADRVKMGEFDEKGGIGYHARKPPHAECPECFGEGVGRVHLHDTRKVSPAAARLFAGIKESKDGFEVKIRDQDGALMAIGRHNGMFKDKLELGGKVQGSVSYVAEIPPRGT